MDMDGLRARFPALRRVVNGDPVAYFDGPGGTQVPMEVADAVRRYLLHHNANSGWNYATSRETDAIVDGARADFAEFFGGRPDEVAFGPNMTSLTLRISRALGRELSPGDPIVVTELDHHANVDPWKAVARERDAVIRVARLDPSSGTLDIEDLFEKIDGARIVAIGAASNATGAITDVATITAHARATGALTFLDAVHFAPHRLLDVGALGADFVVVSPYKFYGPHLGVLWGRKALLERLDLPRVESAPDQTPDRVETGTMPFENIAGAAEALRFIASLSESGDARHANFRDRFAAGLDAIHQHTDPLFRLLWKELGNLPRVRRFGPAPDSPRTPTIAFAVDGIHPREAAASFDAQGLFLSHGDFYATTAVRRLHPGEGGLLRVGIMAFNTPTEVERMARAISGL